MPLDTAELEWIKRVAKVKTQERKAIKARLEEHLVNSGRAAEPSKLAATASADDIRKDGDVREAARARREDELQNVVADKLEISANTVFTVTGADNKGGAAVPSTNATPLDPAIVIKRADVRAKAVNRVAAKGADPKRDRAIAAQIAQAADSVTFAGYKPYKEDGTVNTAPIPVALKQAVDERKIQIEIDNEVNDQIAARIATEAPETMHPLTRNEKIEAIVTSVAAEYGVTNLGHLIGRHGAQRTNPETKTVSRTTDDMVGRLVTGVGADKKAATIGASTVPFGDVSANLSGTAGPGTGPQVVVPGFTTVGSEAAVASSQHASAKAAIFMAEAGAAEAARVERTVGAKAFKAEESVKADVGKEAIGGERLGSYEEAGKLGKSFSMPDPLEINRGDAIAPGDIAERIRHTTVTKDNPSADVTQIVDKVHGGTTPMTIVTRADARTAGAKLMRGRTAIASRDDHAAQTKQLEESKKEANDLVTKLTAPTGPQATAKIAADSAENQRKTDANAAENAITTNLPAGKQDLARTAQAKTIEAAQAARARDDIKARLDKTQERVKQLKAEQQTGDLAADEVYMKALAATIDAAKPVANADQELKKAQAALDLDKTNDAKKKDVAEKTLALKKATELQRQAKEDETAAKVRSTLARPADLKKAEARADQLAEEHRMAGGKVLKLENERDEAKAAFADGVDPLKVQAVAGTFDTVAKSTIDAKSKQSAKDKIDKQVLAAKAQKDFADRELAVSQVSAAVPQANVEAGVPGAASASALQAVAQAAANAAAQPAANVGKAARNAAQAGQKKGDIIAAARAEAYAAALLAANAAAGSATPPITTAVAKAIATRIADKLALKAAEKAMTIPLPTEVVVNNAVTAAKDGARDGAKSVGANTAKAAVEAALQGANEAIAQVTASFAANPVASPAAVQAAADAAKGAAIAKAVDAAKNAAGADPDEVRPSAYKSAFEAAYPLALAAAKIAFDTKVKAEQELVRTGLANALKSAASVSPDKLKEVADEQKKGLDEQKEILAETQQMRAEGARMAKDEHRLKSETATRAHEATQTAAKNLQDAKDRPKKVQERLDNAQKSLDGQKKELSEIEEALKTDATVGTSSKLTEEKDKHEELKAKAAKLGEEAETLAKDAANLEKDIAEKEKAAEAARRNEKNFASEKSGAESNLKEVEAKKKEAGGLRDESASLTKTVQEGGAAAEQEAKEIEELSKQVEAKRLSNEQLLTRKKAGDEAVENTVTELSDIASSLSQLQVKLENQQQRLDEVVANKTKVEQQILEAEAKKDEKTAAKLRKKLAGFTKPIEKRTADLRKMTEDIESQALDLEGKQKSLEELRGAQVPGAEVEKVAQELEALQNSLQERTKQKLPSDEKLAQQNKELDALAQKLQEAEKELASLPSSEELAAQSKTLDESAKKAAEEAGALEKAAKEQEQPLQEKREAQKGKQKDAEAAGKDRDLAEASVQKANEQHEIAKSEREAAVKKQETLTKEVETSTEELKAATQDKADCDTNNAANLQQAEKEEAAAKVQETKDRKAAREARQVAKRLQVEKANAKALGDAEVALAEAEHEARVAKAVIAASGGLGTPQEQKAAAVATAKAAHAAAVKAHAAAQALHRVGVVDRVAALMAHKHQKAKLQKLQTAVQDIKDKQALGTTPLAEHETKQLARLAALEKSENKAEAKIKTLENGLKLLKQADTDSAKEVENKKAAWDLAAQ